LCLWRKLSVYKLLHITLKITDYNYCC
jgi:hypothetical protein